MISAASATRTAPPTRCTVSTVFAARSAADRTRDALDSRAQDRRKSRSPASLALFCIFDGDAQGTSENQVEVMAAAGLVAQRNESGRRSTTPTPVDPPPTSTIAPSRTSAAPARQTLRRRGARQVIAGVLQDVAAGSRLGLRHAGRRRRLPRLELRPRRRSLRALASFSTAATASPKLTTTPSRTASQDRQSQ